MSHQIVQSPKAEGEKKQRPWWKRLLSLCLHSPVQCLFALFLLFFLSRIYLLGQDGLDLKLKAGGVIFLWIFWIFAKSILKFLAVIVFLVLGVYGYYYYSNLDKIQCEDHGGYWNSKTEKCEDKGNLWQQVKRWLDIPALSKD